MGRKKGYKHLEKTKRKIGDALRGRTNPLKGRKIGPYSKERAEKTGRARKGIFPSAEMNRKRSLAQMGEDNHFYGKTHKESSKEKIRKALTFYEEIPNNNSVLCEYGCGSLAKYVIGKNRQYCCSEYHSKCPEMKRKNAKGNKGKKQPKGKDSKLFGRKRPDQSVWMKKRWEDDSYRRELSQIFLDKGIKRSDEQIGKIKAYYRRVRKHTRRSIERFWNVINPQNKLIGIGDEFYSIDHIYSKIDGFNNDINPQVIGNYSNLQVISWVENIKKGSKSWISLNELLERYKQGI